MTNFWNPYFDTVKLWVTEHSCNGDPAFETGSGGSVLSIEQCRRITGQSCAHGQGSVRTMLEMENIERFSWFTLRGDARLDHPNYNSITNGSMTDPQSDNPTFIGKALQTGLDPSSCKKSETVEWFV